MIVVHRGAGMLVPVFGILGALFMNILTSKIFDYAYYQEHSWPKLVVLLGGGICCLTFGVLLERKRDRDAEKERAYIDSLNDRTGVVKDVFYGGPRDHLMMIPLKYWSILYFVVAGIYVYKTF